MIRVSSRLSVKSRTITRFLHHVAYPLLTGFLFDLSWINQVLISSSLVLAVVIVGDFAEALLVLWQAVSVAGFTYMVIAQINGFTVSSMGAATSVIFFWILLLVYSRKVRNLDIIREPFLIKEILTTISFIFITFNAPRGAIANLSFIAHEDNSKQLIAPMEAARTGQIGFKTLSLSDRDSVGYFSKFVANFVLNLNLGSSDVPALKAIQAISNMWVFLLLSFLIIGIQLHRRFLDMTKSSYKNFFLCLGFIVLYRSFYVEHLHGFLPLFLLGLVGIVFICTSQEVERQSNFQILIYIVVGASLSFSMIGSWQPWAPVGFSAVVLVLYKGIGRKKLRTFLSPFIVAPAFAISAFVLIRRLPQMIADADLESGGPAYVDSEVLIVFGMTIFGLVVTSIRSHFGSQRSNDFEALKSDRAVHVVFFVVTSLALSLIMIFGIPQNQMFTICLLIFLGYLFLNRPSQVLSERQFKLFLSEKNDIPVMLCIISFLYIFFIYLASRYVGPNFFANYASHKSSTVYLAQFSWLPILAISWLGKKDFLSLVSKLMLSFCLILLFSINSSISAKPNSEWFLLKFSAKNQSWWHSPVVNSLRTDKEQILLCSNNDILANDYQTYVCNRFLHSLFAEVIQGEFRYQQTSMSGPRPEDLSRVRKYLEKNVLGISTTVFSKEPLSLEMLNLFSSQRAENMHFIVAS